MIVAEESSLRRPAPSHEAFPLKRTLTNVGADPPILPTAPAYVALFSMKVVFTTSGAAPSSLNIAPPRFSAMFCVNVQLRTVGETPTLYMPAPSMNGKKIGRAHV